jgi:hypothetical protein
MRTRYIPLFENFKFKHYISHFREMAIPASEYNGTIKKTFDASFDPETYTQYKIYPQKVMQELAGTSHDRVLLDLHGRVIDDSGKAQGPAQKKKTNAQDTGLKMSVNTVLQFYGVDRKAPQNEIKNVLDNFIKNKKNEQKLLVDPIDKLSIQVAAIKTILGEPLNQEDQHFVTGASFEEQKAIFEKIPEVALKSALQKKQQECSAKRKEKRLYDDNFENVVQYVDQYISADRKADDIQDQGRVIVISRRMLDFASQSTMQNWTSCQNLAGGAFKHKVGSSFAEGAMVAYLMNSGDIGDDLTWSSLNSSELHNALARVLMKPAFPSSGKGDPFWYVDQVYKSPSGVSSSEALQFRSIVTQFFSKHNSKLPDADYATSEAHYHESGTDYTHKIDPIFRYVHAGDFSNIDKLPKEDLEQMFNRYPKMIIQNWDMTKRFPDLSIDTLDLSNADIRKIPRGIKAKNYNLSGTNIEKLTF